MKVGALRGKNYLAVVGRKTLEGLTVHPHQLHFGGMTSAVTHGWLALVQAVGLRPSTFLLANDLDAKVR